MADLDGALWLVLASNRADGAVWSILPLAAQALQNCVIFALSIRRGVGGVDLLDRLMLAVAGLGVAGGLFHRSTLRPLQ